MSEKNEKQAEIEHTIAHVTRPGAMIPVDVDNVRRLSDAICHLHAMAQQPQGEAQPIGWYETEPSCRGISLQILLSGIGQMTHSARWHWQSERPETSNPVWPIYAGPSQAAPVAQGLTDERYPACKGMNCGCTNGVSHSQECSAEHAAVIAGGKFVKNAETGRQAITDALVEHSAGVFGHYNGEMGQWVFDEYRLLEFARSVIDLAAPTPSASPVDQGEDARDSARLDYVLANSAFIVFAEVRDGKKQFQLYTQDEDEEYHILSGDERCFSTEREAIDAAMSASKEGH